MDEARIDEWVDQLTKAVEATAPGTNWLAVAIPPLAVTVAALLAFFLGRKTLKQKQESDDRAEWWRRTQWALDAWLSDDPARSAQGKLMFEVLTESELAKKGSDEAKFLGASREQLDRDPAEVADPEPAEPLSRDDIKEEILASNPGLSKSDVKRLVDQALNGDLDETAANEDNEGIKEEGR